MRSRELVRKVISGEITDRVPVFPVLTRNLGARALGCSVGDIVLDPDLSFEGLRAIKKRFGFDGMECCFGQPKDAPKPRLKRDDGACFLVDSQGKPYAEFQEDDDPIPLDRRPVLLNKSDLDTIEIPQASSYEKSGQLDEVLRLRGDMGEDLYIAGVAASQTMNSLAVWRGSEQAIYDLVDDPAFVHELMDLSTDISIEAGKALVTAGVDGIYIGDAWSSASIISPRQFEEFCLPRYARTVEAFHALGVQVYLHICGNSIPILEMMADTGADAIEPLDPLGGVEISEVVRRVGDRVSLKGGVNTLTLLSGTPDEVMKETLKVLDAAAGKCRGLILGSGDDIPRDTPFENLDAMIQTARSYGN